MSIVEIDYEKLIEYVKNNIEYRTTKDKLLNLRFNIFPIIKKWLDKNKHNVAVNEVADVVYDLGELKKEIEISRIFNTTISKIDIENSFGVVQKCDKMIMISTIKYENNLFDKDNKMMVIDSL